MTVATAEDASGNAVPYIETCAREHLDLADPVVNRFPTDSSHNDFFSIASGGTRLLAKVVRDYYLSPSSSVLHEQAVMGLAHHAGLSPRPWHASVPHRLLIQDFLTGESLAGWTGEHIAVCAGLGAQLMRVELGNTDLCRTHLEYRRDIYAHVDTLRSLDGADPVCEGLTATLLRLARPALAFCLGRQRQLDNLPTVLSHNDISPDNVIRTPRGLMMIDFETAGLSRPDFLAGQIAVDAAIDDALRGVVPRPFDHLWSMVLNILPYEVPEDLCRSRVIERLLQNAAYGLRQAALFAAADDRRDYVRGKLAVAEFCRSSLDVCLGSW